MVAQAVVSLRSDNITVNPSQIFDNQQLLGVKALLRAGNSLIDLAGELSQRIGVLEGLVERSSGLTGAAENGMLAIDLYSMIPRAKNFLTKDAHSYIDMSKILDLVNIVASLAITVSKLGIVTLKGSHLQIAKGAKYLTKTVSDIKWIIAADKKLSGDLISKVCMVGINAILLAQLVAAVAVPAAVISGLSVVAFAASVHTSQENEEQIRNHLNVTK